MHIFCEQNSTFILKPIITAFKISVCIVCNLCVHMCTWVNVHVCTYRHTVDVSHWCHPLITDYIYLLRLSPLLNLKLISLARLVDQWA